MNVLIRLLAQVDVNESELNIPPSTLSENTVMNALQLLFGVAGGIALIIVTVAGFKYVVSQGNPQETAKAKNTILYALIGLAICVLSFTIVTFVINEIAP